jgi:AraC-like DNA-binding protein
MLDEIEARYCFYSQAQLPFTADGMKYLFEHAEENILYEVEDRLGIHLCFFLFQKHLIGVGPFVIEPFSDAKARASELDLTPETLSSYQVYYASYRCVQPEELHRTINGALMALQPNAPAYTFQKLSGSVQKKIPEQQDTPTLDFDIALRQFEIEKEFLSRISDGLTEEALEIFTRMKTFPDAQELSHADLKQIVLQTTGMRFVLRALAEYKGVPISTVYTLSVLYQKELNKVRNPHELDTVTVAMIRDFSDAIRFARSNHYSPTIGNVVSHLKMHLCEQVDMDHLSIVADCTPEYLGRRFKAETGMTVLQFITKERCQVATHLLRQTDLPINKISEHVGYLDNNYFIKVFKKNIGVTPTAYRKKFRQ